MDLTPFHGSPAPAPRVPGFAARTLLGFGAHGEVWLADDLTTGGSVALKIGRRAACDPVVPTGVPPDGPAPDLSSVRSFEQETALLARIEHPHVVRLQRVVPLGATDLALVLDLAAGGSLASLVAARGPFAPGEVTTMLVPLAGALDHLHRRGVVHGDIAPGNVLFTGDGRPQLGDLGVARVLGSRAEETWATPGFTDPAMRVGTSEGDSLAADRWSLAAVGWFALTGRPPEPDSVTAALDAGQAPELTELLADCLVADPARRPGLDELADRAWQAARPTPIRLIGEPEGTGVDVGLPPLSRRVTHRVRVPVAVPVKEDHGADRNGPAFRAAPKPLSKAGPKSSTTAGARASSTAGAKPPSKPRAKPPSGSRSGPPSGPRLRATTRRRVGSSAAAAGVAAIGVITVLTTGAIPSLSLGGSGVTAAGTASAATATTTGTTKPGTTTGTTTTGPTATGPRLTGSRLTGPTLAGTASRPSAVSGLTSALEPGLDQQFDRALVDLGRSRAAAFASASIAGLAGVDQAGSPAYRADLSLVQRLRARERRLEGVRFDVEKVHVLQRRAEAVEVVAVVTTSGHRQVSSTSTVSVEVPPDGPRSVIFTMVPLDAGASGPIQWRIQNVRAAS